MGNIKNLEKHYDKKWCSIDYHTYGKRKCFAIKMKLSDTSKNEEKDNPSEIDVVLEYDGNKPRYGIYFGCKIPLGEKMSEALKNAIWNEYKPMVYGNKNVSRDNIFLPDCEPDFKSDCKQKDTKRCEKWAFWIRLEEESEMGDGINRIKIMKDILEKNGYEICE